MSDDELKMTNATGLTGDRTNRSERTVRRRCRARVGNVELGRAEDHAALARSFKIK